MIHLRKLPYATRVVILITRTTITTNQLLRINKETATYRGVVLKVVIVTVVVVVVVVVAVVVLLLVVVSRSRRSSSRSRRRRSSSSTSSSCTRYLWCTRYMMLVLSAHTVVMSRVHVCIICRYLK